MENIFFYFFSFLLLASAGMMIIVRNPVHSVLFLMVVFCNASGLLILLGADFLALIFLMVYVGAIAVLFLFVIMMLNIKLIEWHEFLFRYLPIGGVLWILLVAELLWIVNNDFISYSTAATKITGISYTNWISVLNYLSNIEVIGYLTYTVFSLSFIVSSLILLVAMVGAIVLTMYSRSNLKRQSLVYQLNRNFEDAVKTYK